MDLFNETRITGIPRLWASISGGQTSMKMAWDLKQKFDGELLFVFANSGEESEKTLEFVDRCDREWDLGAVWVEAVVHEGTKSSTHRVVDFATASRRGEPFEAVIAKYGIPNRNFPHCTRELKLNPMRSYVNAAGWGDAPVAIGIRADEPRRLRRDAATKGIVYPLAHWWRNDKSDVNWWWESMPFRLGLEEREGNCKWCFKKSLAKHFANITSNPEWYDFPRRMEATHTATNRAHDPQVFFRGGLSTDDLFRHYQAVGMDNDHRPSNKEFGGCSESCEAFGQIDEAA